MAVYRAEHKPVGPTEDDLVEQLVMYAIRDELSVEFLRASLLNQSELCDTEGTTDVEGIHGAIERVGQSPGVQRALALAGRNSSAYQKTLVLLKSIQANRPAAVDVVVEEADPAALPSGADRIRDLESKLKNDDTREELLWELFNSSLDTPYAERPVNWREILEGAVKDCYLGRVGLDVGQAILGGATVILSPEVPATALCERIGITRRTTATDFARRVRQLAETERDWAVRALKGYLAMR
jgi:hypothetical protein